MNNLNRRAFSFFILIFVLIVTSLACRSNARNQDVTPTLSGSFTSTAESAPVSSDTGSVTESAPISTDIPPSVEIATITPIPNFIDLTPPVISEAHTSRELVYYGKGSCGPTRISVEAQVSDETQVKTVWVEYRFSGAAFAGSVGDWNRKYLINKGGTAIYADIVDLQFEALKALNLGNGVLEYQVVATDTSDNKSRYPAGSILVVGVKVCK